MGSLKEDLKASGGAGLGRQRNWTKYANKLHARTDNTEKDRHLHKRGSRMVERLKSKLAGQAHGRHRHHPLPWTCRAGSDCHLASIERCPQLQTKNSRILFALVIDDLDRLMM